MGIEYSIDDETFIVPIEYDYIEVTDVEWIDIGIFLLNEWDIQQGNYIGTLKCADPLTVFGNSKISEFTSQYKAFEYSDIFYNAFKSLKPYFNISKGVFFNPHDLLYDLIYPYNNVPFIEWAKAWGIDSMDVGQIIQIYCNANLSSARYSNDNRLEIFEYDELDPDFAYESGLIGDIVHQDYVIVPDIITEAPNITQKDLPKEISVQYKNITKSTSNGETVYTTEDKTIIESFSGDGVDYSFDNPILTNHDSYIKTVYIPKNANKLNKYKQTVELSFRADPRLQPLDIILVKSLSIYSEDEDSASGFDEDIIYEEENIINKEEYCDIVMVTDVEYSFNGAFNCKLKGLILAYNIQTDSNKYEVFCTNEDNPAVLYSGAI